VTRSSGQEHFTRWVRASSANMPTPLADRAFTIHDREDSADLMNLVRHDLGFSKTKKRFPMKGTCLAIYSRTVNTEVALEEVLASFFPWCVAWEAELRRLFSSYVVAKQQQHVLDYDDLLLYWAQMMQELSIAVDLSGRFDHVLVDEYQAEWSRPHCGWR
jgi:DNA helicase-2/ATP-dependent DNA helicase PcrA